MKLIYIIILILFISIKSFSQVHVQWQKCFGGTGTDNANSIKQTFDGGYIFIGGTASIDLIGNHGGGDFLIVKINRVGNIQWQYCFGGTGWDQAYSIEQLPDSGYIIAGTTMSNDGDVSGWHGGKDFWVVRIDSSGNLIWQKCLGGSQWDEVESINQTSDGGYIVLGSTDSNDGDVSGNHGNSDYWVVKLNSLGNIEWQKCLGGTSFDEGKSITQILDGDYIVAGYTLSEDCDITGNHGISDSWIVKLDNFGNMLWQKCYGGSGEEWAFSIIQTSDGGFVFTSSTGSSDGDVSGAHGNIDFWVVKTDSLGNIQWQKTLGGSDYETPLSILQTNDDGFVVSGCTKSNDGDVFGIHGNNDFWVVKLDISGNLIWQKCFGGILSDISFSIIKSLDGGFIIAGNTYSTDGDVIGNHGGNDAWLVKFIESNIVGQVFNDINSNGIKDTGEQGVAGHLIKIEPGPFYTFTNNDGNYYFNADTGQHTVSYVTQAYWITTNTSNYTVYLDSVTQVIDTLDFGVISKINMPDVTVYNIGSPISTNQMPHYWLTYKNRGTTTASGTINFTYPSILTYNNSTQIPTSQVGNTLVWNYDTLGPGAQRIIRADFDIPGIQYLGDTIYSSAWISPITPDSNITNNYDTLRQIITGAYDPNDKTVMPKGAGDQGYVFHGQKLDYTIRFQNTGTDTAFTVVIRDTLSSVMNIETFLVEASSHNVTWELLNNHEIVFRFQNILLPDSNVNEPLSHGFIRYSISPLSGLPDFSEVNNTAYIFFDYNPAIITNTTTNTYVSVISSDINAEIEKPTIKAYPNPSEERFLINLPEFTNKIQVYNLQGELLQSFVPEKQVVEINLKNQTAGVYFVKLYTLSGIVTVKVVKK